MEERTPMDRLVCGDVGFGKTEVAVRAAFKAVQDGKQVAMLVPTTLLAQQHAQTFADRYRSMPVRVAMLSRFLTPHRRKRFSRVLPTVRWTSSSAPTGCWSRASSSRTSGFSWLTRSSGSGSSTKKR